MDRTKFLYLILFIAIGAATINAVFASSITTLFASPSITLAGASGQYAVKFTPVTSGNITSIVLTFPTGTNLVKTQLAQITGITGAVTLTNSSNVLTMSFSSQSVSSSTPIYMFLGKMQNTNYVGAQSLGIITKNGGSVVDSGTATFGIVDNLGNAVFVDNSTKYVGINNANPAHANVILQNNAVLTIPSKQTLNIDFMHNHLLVNPGSGVYIIPGGKIS